MQQQNRAVNHSRGIQSTRGTKQETVSDNRNRAETSITDDVKLSAAISR